jgi:hypothetical protein
VNVTEGDGSGVEMPGSPAALFTVGRLRAELVGWPDETPVAVFAQRSFDGSSWASLDVVAAGSGSIDGLDGAGSGSVFPLVAALPEIEVGDGRAPWRHLATVHVVGTPASYSTAAEKPWREAVRNAVAGAVSAPASGAFAVRLDFRTARPQRRSESWDLDNLAKCTIDALEGALGERPWKGPRQVADHLVVHLQATKREVVGDEPTGATIEVWSREIGDS